MAGRGWLRLVFSSEGSSGVPLVLFKEKKNIYIKIKNLKADFSCSRKTNIKHYPCPGIHVVSVCASLQVLGWHLIQQAIPLTSKNEDQCQDPGPPTGVGQTEEGWDRAARQEALVQTLSGDGNLLLGPDRAQACTLPLLPQAEPPT